MSFILDALRKSENERQRGSGPSFADVKSARPGHGIPLLWIGLGALLLINIVALGVLLIRRGETTQAARAAPTSSAATAEVSTPLAPVGQAQATTDAASVASPLPAAAAPSGPVVDSSNNEEAAPEPLLDRPQLSNYAADTNLPTMSEVIVQGRAQLPELHLDMHVFMPDPEQRFVSINSRKLREGMQVEEGLHVERITPDGVVLNQRGLRFLLPRQ